MRLLSLLVPRDRREEWLEEWIGEWTSLRELRREGGAGDYPGEAWFVVGALPHALWIRTEGWTMDGVAQDLKYAWRVLRRSPAFTVVAALTLALGIGANASMFSLVNGLLLRGPSGIRDGDRLVQIARSYDQAPRWDNWSWPASKLIGEASPVFSGVAGFSAGSFLLGRGEDVEALRGEYVSARYFQLLGVTPAAGRLLDERDEVAPGSHPVVVLSHGLWTRRFGGDPRVVGSTIPIGSEPYEVVGVAPVDFLGIDAVNAPPDVWVPAYQRTSSGRLPLFESWGSSWFYLFGRLQDGVSFDAAVAAMDPVTTRLRSAAPENEDIRVLLAPGVGLSPQERAQGKQVTVLLSGIALLVLLLTCANVGNLFLARATDRVSEVGVRQALGAGRNRLVRQLVTESLALALMATVLAVRVVMMGGALLPTLIPWQISVSLAPDARVFTFMAAVGLVAGLLFGVVPSWAIARGDVARVLREGGTTGGRSRTRLRDALVVGQLALSLGLVSGAGLLGRSVLNARSASPGFNPDQVLVGFVNLRATGRYGSVEGDMEGFQTRLVSALEALPGVEAAALAGQAPILGGHARSTVVPLERANEPDAGFEAEYTPVTPGYFAALQIPVLRGRTFRAPAEEPEPVVVVNQALADLFWPGEDAVGKELAQGEGSLRVVGVVADVQMRSLRAPANPGVYYPYHQAPPWYLAIHVRTAGPTRDAMSAVRRAVSDVDPEVPVTGLVDLREGTARSLTETRTFVMVVSTFASLALILSLIGLYGLVSHGVARRAREMGIRMALGAGRGALVRLVLHRAVGLALVGVVAGVLVAVGVGRALRGVLFGIGPSDPLVLGAAAVALTAAAVGAAWVPARRASRVDAMVSLREE